MKYIILLILAIYLFYRIGGSIMRFLMVAMGAKPKNFSQPYDRPRKKAANSDLNIDYIPKKKGKKGSFDDGEYVDFEEVD
ncbi:MAG: hypothetical protein ACR2MX_05765 [Cyclobacteriaceae bacterium]